VEEGRRERIIDQIQKYTKVGRKKANTSEERQVPVRAQRDATFDRLTARQMSNQPI